MTTQSSAGVAATTIAKKGPVETEITISTEILIMLFLIMLAITLGHFLKKSKHKYLQEAGLTTLLGIIAGIVMRYTHENFLSKNIS